MAEQRMKAREKTVQKMTKIDIHRGTEGYLEADGTWILDYIVLP